MTRVLAQKPASSVAPPKPDAAARHDASNEEFEQEADRAAERASALPATLTSTNARPEVRSRATVPPGDMSAVPESVTRTLAEPGSPLEPELKRDMEQRFGHDFSKVRVHAGHAAADSALDVNAQAYTAGHHVVFGAGKFAPTAHDGRRRSRMNLRTSFSNRRAPAPTSRHPFCNASRERMAHKASLRWTQRPSLACRFASPTRHRRPTRLPLCLRRATHRPVRRRPSRPSPPCRERQRQRQRRD
jgi:hypothetical protein